jgi:hypothetical protein
MSMESRVFFRGEVPDTAALTQALHELGFPISVVPPDYPLQGHKGFMPMLLRGKETGAEFYLDDGRDAIKEMIAPNRLSEVDLTFDRCASFRFGGDDNAFVCGWCAAAALAKLVNGIVYEEQEGVLWSIDTAIKEARSTFDKYAK